MATTEEILSFIQQGKSEIEQAQTTFAAAMEHARELSEELAGSGIEDRSNLLNGVAEKLEETNNVTGSVGTLADEAESMTNTARGG